MSVTAYYTPPRNTRKGRNGVEITVNPGDCILWEGNLNSAGYGRMYVEYSGRLRRQRYVHRIAWESVFGEIPDGLEVDHLCVNPACIYLGHLELVTPEENRRRSNSRVTKCPRGHRYSKDNTYLTGQGSRACRTCHRVRERVRSATLRGSQPIQVFGIRARPEWADLLELQAQGYSILRMSEITGVSRIAIRKHFPGYRVRGGEQ